MATYTELYDLRNNSTLKNKIAIACIIAAESIRTEDVATVNHANRLLWAKSVFSDPDNEAVRMMMALIAQFNTSTINQILNSSDVAIQNAVNNSIDVFAVGV